MEEFGNETRETHDCLVNLRRSPVRRKEKVVIGCGAGFAGDRPAAAVKLLQRVNELDYLVLECLAERTLAERYRDAKSGGSGYDPRISEWMRLLLPPAVESGVRIITNMGAKSPYGAQEEVLRIASELGISIRVGLAYQLSVSEKGVDNQPKLVDGDVSVYLGAAPIVECLERYAPDVLITSRVADASLFLGPMVFELGWNWDEFWHLAQGSLAGHLLECGCQLTGGYYMHPGDKHRNMSFQDLLQISLPYAEVTFDGTVSVAKAEGTRGVLNCSTCAEQLLYEVGDPSSYITPDVVRAWMEESYPGIRTNIFSYIIGRDSLKATSTEDISSKPCEDIRLRMDGLFEKEEHAIQFTKEFIALYTNGPAGGGGISTGSKKENFLEKQLVGRENVHWQISVAQNNIVSSTDHSPRRAVAEQKLAVRATIHDDSSKDLTTTRSQLCAAPAGQKIPLYDVAHSRVGDKGNDLNFSLIPHYPQDIERLKMIVTPGWVKEVVSRLLNPSSFPDPDDLERRDEWIEQHVKVEIYEARGIHSLNVVVRNILDGGVNCSRRIDRHGKTISDLVLCQQVVLPP